MPDRYVENIRQISLFSQLPPDQLDHIVGAFQVLRFQPGNLIVREGSPTQGMFVFVSGEAILTRHDTQGNVRRVGEVNERNSVADLDALLREGTEGASLHATHPSTVLFLSRSRFLNAIAAYPEIRRNLVLPGQQPAARQPLSTNPAPAPVASVAPQAAKPAAPVRTTQSVPAAKPTKKVDFQGLRANETEILTLRRHPWAFVRRGWSALLLFIVLIVAAVVAPVVALQILFVGIGVVFPTVMMIYFYLEWRNDYVVVTDQRVVRVENIILTFRTIMSEMRLDSIQEINAELPPYDAFARIFNYGHVELKNAGDAGDLILDMVPDPEAVQKVIFTHRERSLQNFEGANRNAIRAEIEKSLGLDADEDGPRRATAAQRHEPDTLASRPQELSVLAMRFTNKDGDTVYRKHLTVWAQHVIAPSVFLLGGISIFLFGLFAAPSAMLRTVEMTMGVFVVLIGTLWFYWADWDWRNDMYVVSNDTVTIIHRRPLWLQNEVEQILLRQVDNVSSEVSGPLNVLFNRGDVSISLVGEGLSNAKMFRAVHRPHEVQAEISRRQARAKQIAQDAERAAQREAITEYLSVYNEVQSEQDGSSAGPSSAGARVPEDPPPSQGVQPGYVRDGQRPPRTPRRRF